ncbi:hypothetical protein [Roseateles saccharophilus]|uniref:Uncharacterized protein n=1 Tax=Roseateles saccharophilus TaxID=304 RepID=A0A4R3UV23_ROSSA|nr:hypothetical protein [Roseateles saccharophilus]MDG0833131.1 hypothetical protein [Roseateles saccharophilus]TCU94597.1 hypothetical protein EV671_101619 [Roseateles saccharophilus]
MDLSTEQVHWLGGAFFTATALLLLLRRTAVLHWRWLDFLLPLLFVGYGLESAADVWLHGSAVPQNYAGEARQHLMQGSAMMIAGVVQGLIEWGKLKNRWWQLAVPVALAFTGAVFWMHAHENMAGSMALVMTEHRFFAASLWVAASAKALAVLGGQRAQALEVAWLLPLLLFGLQLLLYTEQA